jgi:GH24 family phage-related lysozyme (muramidase)/uncharacterized protein YcbK (DUF882 family)
MIKLSDVFCCGYYKGLPHQKDAIAYLQSQLSQPQLNEFSRQWRKGADMKTPINLKDVPDYYAGFDWQNDAIAYLQSIVSSEVLAKFTAIWRSPEKDNGINRKAIALIKSFEGCELTAYDDGVGIPTIGWGHTEGVRMGDRITQDQADRYLEQDAQVFTNAVRELVKVPLTIDQEAALISFAYNVGVGAFAESTLLKQLNSGNYQAVPSEIARWINEGSPVEQGLRNRRAVEAKVWSGDIAKSVSKESIDWNNPDSKVSKYFTVKEVTQRDNRRIPKDPVVIANILKLAVELDKVREKWGKPIGVTSWYRPVGVNAEVGGAFNSTHIDGIAADIYDIGGKEYEFEDFLDKFWGNRALGYGVASGKGFSHLDLRDDGRRWNY